MKTSNLLFEKQNVSDPPKSHQTSRFPVTVFIHVSNNDCLGKLSYNFVVLHSNILWFLHVTLTCLVIIVRRVGTPNSIHYDVTPFYVQEYVYFKNVMFYKGVCRTLLKVTSLRWNKTYGKNDKRSVKLRLPYIITESLKSIQVLILFLWQLVHSILTYLVFLH